MSILEVSQIAANYASVVSMGLTAVVVMVSILTYMDCSPASKKRNLVAVWQS
ncbi:hypothetical protein J2W49_001059 [Hydrogenophaga palleronii]|uniref:Uncharacterized protein n=1 Tax=Hydrogenophaga palleronii TaxID=65655 RepID=A0ABU1WIK6_9BURK|nr:hypothetical protein [Hydrogenophaga palleronii]MDR7149110.1 hypothetical protein [Hydrogenophaga palleronii]